MIPDWATRNCVGILRNISQNYDCVISSAQLSGSFQKQFHYIIALQMTISFQIVNLFSDFGGNIGLWIGFSIITSKWPPSVTILLRYAVEFPSCFR